MKSKRPIYKVKIFFVNCNLPFTYLSRYKIKTGRHTINNRGVRIKCEVVECKKIEAITCELDVLYTRVDKIDLIQKINGIITTIKGITLKDLEVLI